MKDNKYSYNLLEAFEDLNREETLKESRSVADIEAEIARLQQELKQAKVAEKKASYNGNLPKVVYIWDMYLNPSDKGSWTSSELYNGKWDGAVFETEDCRINKNRIDDKLRKAERIMQDGTEEEKTEFARIIERKYERMNRSWVILKKKEMNTRIKLENKKTQLQIY